MSAAVGPAPQNEEPSFVDHIPGDWFRRLIPSPLDWANIALVLRADKLILQKAEIHVRFERPCFFSNEKGDHYWTSDSYPPVAAIRHAKIPTRDSIKPSHGQRTFEDMPHKPSISPSNALITL